MDRHYVPLRPAATGDDYGNQKSGLLGPLEKRRRVGVSVACSSCRHRKSRCDGMRPTCSNCLSLNIPCSYRDNAELSPEIKKAVVETIGLLSSLPAAEASKVLDSLKSETNGSVILSILRAKAGGSEKGGNETENGGNGARDTTNSFAFETENPTAYPNIPLQRALEQSYPELTPFSQNSLFDTQAAPKGMFATSPRQSSFDMNTKAGPNDGLPELCDPRLEELDIQLWTTVRITNEAAARCISLYLETDHPLLGHFDPELFVSNLVSGRGEYCSSLLVNALLYWACQMYGYFDPKSEELAGDLCAEAERLWAIERTSATDSLTNLAAAEFICLGYLGQGKDHAIIQYITEASEMGTRLGLFGVSDNDDGVQETGTSQGSSSVQRARMFAAWGVFNWITLMSLFYRQPGLFCPRYPPRMAIPECRAPNEHRPDMPQPSSTDYMGSTFPYICRFWCIVHEVSVVYENDRKQPWGTDPSLAFAEFKFRELLAWSNNLPPSHTRGRNHPHQVIILHLWFHAIILDIFRPFIQVPTQQRRPLRTFAGIAVTANDVCSASAAQLKQLITQYRLHYNSSNYTILWQTAIIYVINAILNDERNVNWYSDLLACIYAYESLGRSWRVVASISKGLLSLAMEKSDLSSRAAVRILNDLRRGGLEEISGDVRSTFIADLNLALTDHNAASMEHLAKDFEGNVWMKDYTNVLDDEVEN